MKTVNIGGKRVKIQIVSRQQKGEL